MAKYNWKELEQEYILGGYASVSAFLKVKGIPRGATAKKKTKDWNEKKYQVGTEKVQKTVQKVIEKESTKEANKIVNVKNTAEELLKKINISLEELNKYIAKTTKKTKTVEYDYKVGKPSKEIIDEEEQLSEYFSIIDRGGLKQLTSALKDINDIISSNSDPNEKSSFASEIEKAWKKRNE